MIIWKVKVVKFFQNNTFSYVTKEVERKLSKKKRKKVYFSQYIFIPMSIVWLFFISVILKELLGYFLIYNKDQRKNWTKNTIIDPWLFICKWISFTQAQALI